MGVEQGSEDPLVVLPGKYSHRSHVDVNDVVLDGLKND